MPKIIQDISQRIRDWVRKLINQTIDYPDVREEYVMSSRELHARQLLHDAINMTEPLSTVSTHARSAVLAKNDHTLPCASHRASNFVKSNSIQHRPCSETTELLDQL